MLSFINHDLPIGTVHSEIVAAALVNLITQIGLVAIRLSERLGGGNAVIAQPGDLA